MAIIGELQRWFSLNCACQKVAVTLLAEYSFFLWFAYNVDLNKSRLFLMRPMENARKLNLADAFALHTLCAPTKKKDKTYYNFKLSAKFCAQRCETASGSVDEQGEEEEGRGWAERRNGNRNPRQTLAIIIIISSSSSSLSPLAARWAS